jgi:hypothetical protein
MKRTILKLTSITILAAAIVGTTILSRAEDSTNTPFATPAPTGPAKFFGPVTAVDTNAMTFTVGDQTFTVTGESHLTKSGNPATLADAVVGEPARGSYTTGKDGKLDVTKANFGKKKGGKGGGKKKKDAGAADTNAPAASPQN